MCSSSMAAKLFQDFLRPWTLLPEGHHWTLPGGEGHSIFHVLTDDSFCFFAIGLGIVIRRAHKPNFRGREWI